MPMSPTQNLYYAVGQIAFAVATSDGEMQKEEREKFQSIVSAELSKGKYNFDISSIIFKILEKEQMPAEDTYQWAMHQIRLNSHYLSPEMKALFISVINEIALAFPPVTHEEGELIARFKHEIAPLYGDPVYYN